MSEHEEQEGVFKVTDRRLFNPDGSVRDGVTIEPKPEPVVEKKAEPATETAAVATQEIPSEPAIPDSDDTDEDAAIQEAATNEDLHESGDETPGEEGEDGEDVEIPGEQDPASFVNFIMSLASQAAAALGAMPHPVTGQRSLDLDIAKHWIDTMAMLREKTNGNLHPQEANLLNGLLSDLRMQFIQLSQAAEERLKQQAAQKFSSKDVLGGGR